MAVAGTGTGVGKTFVSSALLRTLGRRWTVLGLKPVESGCERGIAPDAVELSRAAGRESQPRYALRDPVSPHLAAEREQIRISTESICYWVAESERLATAEVAVVETAGGLCSPLVVDGSTLVTNLDLLVRLQPELWVLVASDRLGALHDVEVARIAAASRFRLPNAIVLTEAALPREQTVALGNAAELRRWCPEPVMQGVAELGVLVELIESVVARAVR